MPDPTPSRENLADAQAAAGPCPHHAVAKAWPLMIETIARGFAYREAETAARDARIAELEARCSRVANELEKIAARPQSRFNSLISASSEQRGLAAQLRGAPDA